MHRQRRLGRGADPTVSFFQWTRWDPHVMSNQRCGWFTGSSRGRINCRQRKVVWCNDFRPEIFPSAPLLSSSRLLPSIRNAAPRSSRTKTMGTDGCCISGSAMATLQRRSRYMTRELTWTSKSVPFKSEKYTRISPREASCHTAHVQPGSICSTYYYIANKKSWNNCKRRALPFWVLQLFLLPFPLPRMN